MALFLSGNSSNRCGQGYDLLEGAITGGICTIPTVPEDIPPAKLMKYFTQFLWMWNVGWYVDMLGYDFARKIIRDQ